MSSKDVIYHALNNEEQRFFLMGNFDDWILYFLLLEWILAYHIIHFLNPFHFWIIFHCINAKTLIRYFRNNEIIFLGYGSNNNPNHCKLWIDKWSPMISDKSQKEIGHLIRVFCNLLYLHAIVPTLFGYSDFYIIEWV